MLILRPESIWKTFRVKSIMVTFCVQEGVLVPEKGVSPQANGQKQYVGSTQAISVAGPDTNPRAMLKTQVAQNALVASVRRKRPAEDVEVEEGTKREAEGLESSSLRPGMQDGFENADLRGDAQGSRDLEPTLGQRLEALQLQSAPVSHYISPNMLFFYVPWSKALELLASWHLYRASLSGIAAMCQCQWMSIDIYVQYIGT